MNCPKCGSEVANGAVSCSMCGADFENMQQEQQTSTQPPQKNKVLKIIAAVLAVVVLAVGGLFLANSNIFKKEVEDTGANSTESNEPADIQPSATAPEAVPDSYNIPAAFDGTLEELAESLKYSENRELYIKFNLDEAYTTDFTYDVQNENGEEYTDSILSHKISDFDGDGKDELLILAMESDVDVRAMGYDNEQSLESDTADIYVMYMYEYSADGCVLSATMNPVDIDADIYVTSGMNYDEKEIYDFYLKTPIPFVELSHINSSVYTAENNGKRFIVFDFIGKAVLGDGFKACISIIEYDGEKFVCKAGDYRYASYVFSDYENEAVSEYIPGYSMDETTENKRTYEYFTSDKYDLIFNIYGEEGAYGYEDYMEDQKNCVIPHYVEN